MKTSNVVVNLLIATITILLFAPTISSYLPNVGSVLNLMDKAYIFVLLLLVGYSFMTSGKLYLYHSLGLLFFSISIGLVSNLIEYKLNFSSFVQLLLTFQGVICFYLISQFLFKSTQIERLFYFIILFGVISVLIGLIEIVFPNFVRAVFHAGKIHEEAVIRGGFSSIQSIFGHPGQFSWFLSFCLCISFVKYNFSKRKVYLILSFLFILTLMFTLRRKSIVAIFFVFVFITMIQSDGFKSKLRNFFFTITLISFSFVIFYEQIQFVFLDAIERYSVHEDTATQNVQPRIVLADASVRIATDKFPFGSGLGTFGSWMSKVNYSDIYYEYGVSDYWGLSPQDDRYLNDTYWPMIIGEFGFIGAIGILCFYLLLMKKLVGLIRGTLNSGSLYLTIAFAVFLELFIESFSSPALSRSPQVFIVMAFLGILMSYSIQTPKILRFK